MSASILAFAESMRINATGMFDITREMADLIAQSGGGTIVNIASMQGIFGADFSLYEGTEMDSPPDYHFHKGGMITLTKYLARKMASKKVRVNCISPGYIQTELIATLKDLLPVWLAKMPEGGRLGFPEDLIGAFVYFASDASLFATGSDLAVDGGYTIL